MKTEKTAKIASQFFLSQEDKIRLYEGKIARAEAYIKSLEQTLKKEKESVRGSKYSSR